MADSPSASTAGPASEKLRSATPPSAIVAVAVPASAAAANAIPPAAPPPAGAPRLSVNVSCGSALPSSRMPTVKLVALAASVASPRSAAMSVNAAAATSSASMPAPLSV